MVNDDPWRHKGRPVLQCRAWRLVWEAMAISRARRALPDTVDGWGIDFADTRVTIGRQIDLRSRWLPGRPLMALLYEPRHVDTAIEVAIVTLQALRRANISSFGLLCLDPFAQRIRVARLLREVRAGRASAVQPYRERLAKLLRQYVTDPYEAWALVHGDLQAAHIIVNERERRLGLVDLEATRTGRPATNFAQLWEAFHYADPLLGRALYDRYRHECAPQTAGRFDAHVRAELALRCHSHLTEGHAGNHATLRQRARELLDDLATGDSLEAICKRRAVASH